ncbi:hypothetical protein [Variovorax sp. UC122_21]|uniref:hypothetical protein n=1 Tax=Variovorax sp. UC122_21 TaxID=3374554 RepID=UPI0037565E46
MVQSSALARSAFSASSASGSPRPEKHGLAHAGLRDRLAERAHGLDRAGHAEVGLVGDVDRAHALERRAPGGAVVPVEGGAGVARAGAHRMAGGLQQGHDARAGLAVGAQYENGSCVVARLRPGLIDCHRGLLGLM